MKISPLIAKRSLRISVLIGALGFGFIGAFQNCSNPTFEQSAQTSASSAGEPIDDTGIVKKACQQGNIQTKVQHFNFPNPRNSSSPKKTCNWGKDGNSGTENIGESNTNYGSRFTARAEQVRELDIPKNAVICDLEFAFPTQTDFIYDDEMFFVFDNVLLASTRSVDSYLDKVGDLQLYDWSKLAMKRWGSASVYCLGQNTGESSCAWPRTDTRGAIRMDFSPDVLMKAVGLNLSLARHSFKMVTTGDNNPDKDCSHQEMDFDVQISYTAL